jgi:hypothetical protein
VQKQLIHKNFYCGNKRQWSGLPSRDNHKSLIFKGLIFTGFVNVLAFVNLIPRGKLLCWVILHKVIHKNCGKKPKDLSKPALTENL